MSRVIVIGAGLSGLAAACHLTKAGHQVTVIEREAHPGGRCAHARIDGFSFDTGATVLTMPDLIDEPLRAVGSSVAEALTLTRLDPAYRAVFADGSQLMVRHGRDAMREEIARECGPADAASFDDFVDWLAALYRTEMPNFVDVNYDSVIGLARHPAAMANLVRLRGFSRLGTQVRRWFSDDRLHRLFSFQAMYAGLAPSDALAIYAVITYMDSIEGVWAPAGGMTAVPAALADAAAAAGASFHYGQTVTGLVRRSDGRVAGVRIDDDRQLMADAVVCTMDLPEAYRILLPDAQPPRALTHGLFSPSAVVWHVGVRGVPRQAHHHNIHFGQAWDESFDDLLRHGTLMRDPSRLVSVPSLTDPSVAPQGSSSLYVLEPVPNLQVGTIDWERHTDVMREGLLAFLDQAGYPTDIVTESLDTPETWRDLGLEYGTPFALAHTFTQSGPFRPANHTPSAPGLFFAGSSTVPGVGVPMVLISGKLAAQRVGGYLS
ncbi:phytoene desaturase family protein [Arsenicicoccus piscis]|nr:phytoene desaturase family protein [Arsenicicoccus piscis]